LKLSALLSIETQMGPEASLQRFKHPVCTKQTQTHEYE